MRQIYTHTDIKIYYSDTHITIIYMYKINTKIYEFSLEILAHKHN